MDIKEEKEEEEVDGDFFGIYAMEAQDDPTPNYHTQTFVSNIDYRNINTNTQPREVYDIIEIFSDDLQVDFFKRGRTKNASKVWEYFGRLLNGNNEMVGSRDFHYCSLCLQGKKFVKYRTTSATTSLSNHLETVHGIMKDGEVTEVPRNEDFRQPKKRRFEGGSATVCCECGKNFSCSTILKR